MPFQSPQLLESNSSDRPIQESDIYKPIVPVDAEMQHFVIDTQPLTIKLRRFPQLKESDLSYIGALDFQSELMKKGLQ